MHVLGHMSITIGVVGFKNVSNCQPEIHLITYLQHNSQ
jgi:hypothetical protein